MAKVLVIRKPDRTIHKVPLSNKSSLMAMNKQLPAGKKWIFEEMDEDKADKLPYYDKDFVTPAEANIKVKSLQEQNASKDKEIAKLKAQLEQMNGKTSGGDDGKKEKETVLEVVARIKKATTAEEVTDIVGNDDRKGVTDAAAKHMASFS